MREHVLLFGGDRSLVGILTDDRSVSPEKSDLPGVVLINAGLVHRIGPNRIYVKLARRLAAMGFLVLRFDLSGIGDSGPRRDKLPAAQSVMDETQQAMDYLERSEGIKRFVLIGLCSGAAVAFQVATVDQRVNRAILLNPQLPETDQVEQLRESSYYRRHALFNPRSWLKFFCLQSSYRDVWKALKNRCKECVSASFIRNDEIDEIVDGLRKVFHSIQTKSVKLLLAYSENEIVDKYFRKVVGEEYRSLQESGLLLTKRLKRSDHLFTPLECQKELLDSIVEFMNTGY